MPKGYDVQKVLRVFLKGDINRWIEFPMPNGVTFLNMMGQAKFEGWLIANDRMVAMDAIAAAVEIQTTAAPAIHFPVAGNA